MAERSPNWGGPRAGAGRKRPPEFPKRVAADITEEQDAHIGRRAKELKLSRPAYIRRLIDADMGGK